MRCRELQDIYSSAYRQIRRVFRHKVSSIRLIAYHMKANWAKAEAKATADSNRLIPTYDENAQRPEDVYKLHDIIPEVEFNALSITPLKAAATMHERKALLPHSRSNWINQHLSLIFSAPKPNKTHL